MTAVSCSMQLFKWTFDVEYNKPSNQHIVKMSTKYLLFFFIKV